MRTTWRRWSGWPTSLPRATRRGAASCTCPPYPPSCAGRCKCGAAPGPGASCPIYGDAPHGHGEFGTDADGAYLYPANLLYSRDRDAGTGTNVGSSAAVDAGGHYDILARLS